jgi:hypothetical protein
MGWKQSSLLWQRTSTIRTVTAECHVGREFVAKIEQELVANDQDLVPGEIYGAWNNPIGPGFMSPSGEDFLVLYILYRQQPHSTPFPPKTEKRSKYPLILLFITHLVENK